MRQTKDSGIEWIGQIPIDWNVLPFKKLFTIYSGATPRTENLEYWDGDVVWVTPSDFKTSDKYIEKGSRNITRLGLDSCSTTLVDKGTIIFSKVPIGSVVIASVSLCTNQGCFACVPKEDVFSAFYYYFLSISTPELEKYSLGTTFKQIYFNSFANFKVTLPSINEQTKISSFLDFETSKIKSLIDNLTSQIDKLKEYKKSLITECVTKGLDKDASLKDSGVEWIGKIPENWITIKVKYTSWLKGRIGWQGLKSTEYTTAGPYLITGTDFNNGYINWESCVHISKKRYDEAPEIHIKEDDLLITKDGTVGKVAIAKNCPSEVSLNSGVLLIRNTTNFKYFDKFLYYVLLSNEFSLWYENSQTGNSTIRHLYQEQFYEFRFAYPSLNEQEKIAYYLDKKCSEIDSLISSKQSQIDKLNEYQKSLIYEYVTGKKEVV